MLENWLSKSKQSCLLGFTNLLPIPVVFLPNFKFFYQTLSNSEPNFSIFLTAFGKLLPRPIYWHWRNNLKLNFSMLTRKISTLNTFGTLLLTVKVTCVQSWRSQKKFVTLAYPKYTTSLLNMLIVFRYLAAICMRSSTTVCCHFIFIENGHYFWS